MLALGCVMSTLGWTQQPNDEPPPLPPGLAGGPAQPPEAGPPLPAGLSSDGAETSPVAPALPPGLGEGEAPALPPGLGEEGVAPSAASEEGASLSDHIPSWLHGFWETRVGMRTQKDAVQSKDALLLDSRLQLEGQKIWDWGSIETTNDIYLDGVYEQAEYDMRLLRLNTSPMPWLDIALGRQVLTWGTGDQLFINDLFPKDWVSFLAGREDEYLKAPSDTLRLGAYTEAINIELAYTPQFAPDRFITGRRLSYYNPLFGRRTGSKNQVDYNAPSTWFEDDETALRVYRRIGSSEYALYGYTGYWKSPGGQRLIPVQATFPKLNVFGASVRGNFLKGIGNAEIGYYDSRQDSDGANPFVNNSEFRLLLGYEQELAKEFTGGFQYYLEHMMDYDAYTRTLPFMMPKRDQNRHVFTVRLTKLLMSQNLTLSFFAYYSPSDQDAFLRPKAKYKVTDDWTVEAGANVFLGESDTTFFGQFEDNSNVYASVRWSF